MRGRAARAQIKPHPNKHVIKITRAEHASIPWGLGKKMVNESRLRKSMLVYSAIKIRANPPALYSTLNPETSSLSPSAKSKGARFASARHETSQIEVINGIIMIAMTGDL